MAPALLHRVRACLDGARGAETAGGASLLHGGRGAVARVLGGSAHTVFEVLQQATAEYRDQCWRHVVAGRNA